MKALDIRTAIAWIDTNMAIIPPLLQASMIQSKDRLTRTLERTAAREELEEKKALLKKSVEDSRTAMKALEEQIKAQKVVEQTRRAEDRASKAKADAVKKAETAEKKATRDAAKKAKEQTKAEKVVKVQKSSAKAGSKVVATQ